MKLFLLLFPLVAFCQEIGTAPGDDLLQEVRARPALSLETFQNYAFSANPTLRQAQSIVQQSAALSRQAGLYPNPSIGYQGEQIRGGSYGGGEQGAFVQQSFVLGGKLGLRRNVYEQQRRADEFTLAAQRSRIQNDMGQSFYAALAAQQTLMVRQHLVSAARDAVETARQLANVGQADTPDVLQAEVEGEQAELDYVTAQRDYLQKFAALSALAGKPDLPPSPLRGDLDHPPQIDPAQCAATILRDSPVIKRAQQLVNHAEAELKSARRESVPDLQVRAGVQQNSERISQFPPLAVGLQGFATVGVELPVFNRNQGNVAAAQAAVDRARAEVTRLQLSLRPAIAEAAQLYLASRLEAARYRDALIPRAGRAYHLYLDKYRAMAAPYPQVLLSQRIMFQLQINYVSALARVWKSSIALQNFLLSSGLDEPDTPGVYSTAGKSQSSTSAADR